MELPVREWRWVNIISGYGLVPSGNRPLPGLVLSKFYSAMLLINKIGRKQSEPFLVITRWPLSIKIYLQIIL